MLRFTRRSRCAAVVAAVALILLPSSADRIHAQDTTAEAINRLGFKLYRQLAAARAPDRAPGNIFVSPLSIADVIAMVTNGARGETRAELLALLGKPGATDDVLNARLAALRQHLVSPERTGRSVKFTLAIANAFWAKRGSSLRPAFLRRLADGFDAHAEEADFGDPATLRAINAWAERATDGMIPRIVDRLEPLSFLVLLNAVAFKARWADTFSPRATRPAPFRKGDRTSVDVPMMRQVAHVRYARSDEHHCTAVALRYSGKRARMVLVLPDDGKSYPTWLRTFGLARWQAIRAGLAGRRVDLSMPRMQFSYGAELKKPLAAIGAGGLFGGDLTGISPENAEVTSVMHRTALVVDEQGTKAAAASALIAVPRSAVRPEPPVRFVCDRPFFCVIEDERTGAILFMGVVNDPGLTA